MKPHRYQGFENVQCAACHGPGGRHVRGGTSYVEKGILREGVIGCARCHDKEHDPPFQNEAMERLPLVACPPLEAPGEGAPLLIRTYERTADLFERRGNPPWDQIAELRFKAGDHPGSLAAAERWHEAEPWNVGAKMMLGYRYLDAGRPQDALPLFERIYERHPTNAEALCGLSAAIRPADPETALYFGLEAYSLRASALDARVVALAYVDQNRISQAQKVLDDHLRNKPWDRPQLQDLLDGLAQVGDALSAPSAAEGG